MASNSLQAAHLTRLFVNEPTATDSSEPASAITQNRWTRSACFQRDTQCAL